MRSFIILFLIINVNLIQSNSDVDQCVNYCTSGGACLETNTGPKCICYPEWTGERCENPLLSNQLGKADSDSNLCSYIPDDFCKNGGKCYIDALRNKFACFCYYPYTGEYCGQISDCVGYCDNDGICEVKDEQLKCTCMPGWGGLRCRNPIALLPDPNPHPICTLLGETYCNAGRCTIENGNMKCICPSHFTGNRCEIPARTPTIDPPVSCASTPCRNGGTCYRNGNSYHCFCGRTYTGKNCETRL